MKCHYIDRLFILMNYWYAYWVNSSIHYELTKRDTVK